MSRLCLRPGVWPVFVSLCALVLGTLGCTTGDEGGASSNPFVYVGTGSGDAEAGIYPFRFTAPTRSPRRAA